MATPEQATTDNQGGDNIILEFQSSDFEVLEEFSFEESHARPSHLRYYTLQQQADDLLMNLLPTAERPTGRELRLGQHKVKLAQELYEMTTERTMIGVPHGKPMTREPLHKLYTDLPDWVVPIVDARLIDRSTQHPTGSLGVGFKRYEQKVFAALQKARSTDVAGSMEHAIEGPKEVLFRAQDGSFKSTRLLGPLSYTLTIQQPDHSIKLDPHVLYPSESRGLAGFILANRAVTAQDAQAMLQDGSTEELDRDPPSSQLWFNRTVHLTSYRDLKQLAPRIEDIMEHLPEHGGYALMSRKVKAFLRSFQLGMQDIPYRLLESALGNPEGSAGIGDVDASLAPLQVTQRPAPDASILPRLYQQYMPGETLYRWISGQVDGGAWVRLTKTLAALDAQGMTSIHVPVDAGKEPQSSGDTKISIQECTDATVSYRAFLQQGVYRAATQTCIPVDILKRQQQARALADRLPLQEYKQGIKDSLLLLEEFLHAQQKYNEATVAALLLTKEAAAASASSGTWEGPTHEQNLIQLILRSEEFTNEDKAVELQKVLERTEAEEKEGGQFHMPRDGPFLLCRHVLTQLLAADLDSFHAEYSIVSEGQRMCRLCGEVLTSVVIADNDTEFNDDGMRVQFRDALAGGGAELSSADGAGLTDMQTQLANILQPAKRYDGKIMMMLITVLGLQPNMMALSQFASRAAADTDAAVHRFGSNTALQTFMRGAYAVAWIHVLMKTHRPVLIPTRVFPRIPFSLLGYPSTLKDTAALPNPLLSYLLNVMAFLQKNDPRTHQDKFLVYILENRKGALEGISHILQGIVQGLPSGTEFVDASIAMASAGLASYGAADASAPETATSVLEVAQWAVQHSSEGHYQRAAKAMQRLRGQRIGTVSASSPLVVQKIRDSTTPSIEQQVVHPLVIPKLQRAEPHIAAPELRALVGAKSEAECEKAFRALLQRHSVRSKFSATLDKERQGELSQESSALQSLAICTSVLQGIARTAIGRLQHQYAEQTSVMDNDDTFKEVRQREVLMGSIPYAAQDAAGSSDQRSALSLLQDCLTSALGLDAGMSAALRLDVCTHLVRLAVDTLEVLLGAARAQTIIKHMVTSKTTLYKFSDAFLQTKIIQSEVQERTMTAERYGAMSDSERAITRELQELKLLPIVITSEDRAAIAAVVEDEGDLSELDGDASSATMRLPLTDFNEDEDPRVAADEGYYGDLQDYEGTED